MKNKNKANEEIIYKCIYNRKDEANRQKLHLGAFCNATLKAKIGVRLNTKGYIISITKNHSNECLSLIKSNVINNNETINQFIDFKNKVFSMLNDINIYDRKDCKNKIKEIYNNNKYDFQLKKSTINPLASPSAGAPALKYGDVNTVTPSSGEVKGLIILYRNGKIIQLNLQNINA